MGTLKQRAVDGNLNGVARIKVVRVSEVIRVREINQYNLSWERMDAYSLGLNDIRQKSNADIIDIYTPPATATFEEKRNDGVADIYSMVLNTFLPNDSADIRLQMQKLSGGLYLVIFEDTNGKVRLMGSKKSPALLKTQYQTNENGWKLQFLATSTHFCYFLPGWANAQIFNPDFL